MSVVKINAIEVPEGRGEMLEQRFAQRAGAIDGVDGFEGFELLRPTDGRGNYYVYTRWATEEAYLSWREGETFGRSHGEGARPATDAPTEAGGDGGAEQRPQGPVGTGSELLEFEVVISTP